jgi:hypothetical protein
MKVFQFLALALTLAVSSTAFAKQTINISCGSEGSHGVYIEKEGENLLPEYAYRVIVDLEGSLTRNGINDYSLKVKHANFVITSGWAKEGSFSELSVWAAGNTVNQTKANNKDYKPRVYFNHAQFDLSEMDDAGQLKFLINENIFNKSRVATVESGRLIMSWIQDHFGASVPLLCKTVN